MRKTSLLMAEISELIELIELGFSNQEIQQYFPSISIGVIAAHRAHVTRGTYSSGGRSHAIRIESDEQSATVDRGDPKDGQRPEAVH